MTEEEKDVFENDPAWAQWKERHKQRRIQELMTTESRITKRILRLWMKQVGVKTPNELVQRRKQHGMKKQSSKPTWTIFASMVGVRNKA